MSKIIFFDGVCNLCNWSVRFIIKHDKRAMYSFASLQSELARNKFSHLNGQYIKYDSVVYFDGINVLIKSDALIKIVEGFGGDWKLIRVFKLIPKRLRDSLYDFIANYRYQWFGKKENCMIPSPEIKGRFLE